MGTTGGRRVELTSAGGVVSRRLEGDDHIRLFVDEWGMPEESVQRLPPDTPTPPPWSRTARSASEAPRRRGHGVSVQDGRAPPDPPADAMVCAPAHDRRGSPGDVSLRQVARARWRPRAGVPATSAGASPTICAVSGASTMDGRTWGWGSGPAGSQTPADGRGVACGSVRQGLAPIGANRQAQPCRRRRHAPEADV